MTPRSAAAALVCALVVPACAHETIGNADAGGAGGAIGGGAGGGLASANTLACTVAEDALPASEYHASEETARLHISANGIPDHDVGPFPNAHNPNTISAQSYELFVPLAPSGAGEWVGMNAFGVAVNGVVFDPSAAEFYQGDPSSGWQYEALSGAVDLGLDCNHAHVQPNGAYHYHGIPEGLLEEHAHEDDDMLFVGVAADGYPIYARLGHDDPMDPTSALRPLSPSYRLRSGTRPSGPGGAYDGTFVQDYEYVEGLGDLDECNGRVGITPHHGTTYHYVLTDDYPVIPRCFVAQPDASFAKGPPRP